MADEAGLAVITGASSGIGYELARCCAEAGYDLVVAADEPEIARAAEDFRAIGAQAEPVQADLATAEGVEKLYMTLEDRPVELLLANAGQGLGNAFLDQEVADIRRVVDTNITGTILLVHRIGRDMRLRNKGRILFTGSIAGFMPGSFQAVYNATKAFVDSFSWALRNELKDTGITVTCLMPGPTDTEFFERAGMTDTKIGSDPSGMDDPAKVARIGFEAMMRGDPGVVTGFSNKIQAAMAHLVPAGMLAEMHRKMAEPGSAKR
ncbi:SDR family NAD(P)-dependent oxidoreductase [Chelativorans sp. AA-79]|uniref:SDR family NAD(P)-dependent oxidoreductase n=1 Tax=Chelativorans sp. AA-79 TaxID=3028735 RepID=UPI0023F75A1D|nr:SDR family NAD(P)-dependent oxidoreductase [Chelativorans sp. AA-79]WEX09540.1 SDR family NAD(P)-dependent oxidoreductase [Chelativorans sp. AA-79]